MRTTHLFIGMMSGTSLDGVDVAIVEFNQEYNHISNQTFKTIATHFLPYSEHLKSSILALQFPAENELAHSALLSNQLAILYAEAVNEALQSAQLNADQISAIGCHGQTIRHQPKCNDGIGYTLQIGNAALLCELTGITVVSDFRSRDIAASGQGAPLVPAFHHAVFADSQINRAIINIGGIANITYLPASGKVIGFDSGPGNMLIDAWIQQHLKLAYDKDGSWANTGKLITPLLSTMLSEAYFTALPPKSTGRDLFNQHWLSQHIEQHTYLPEDVAHTLIALTARTIIDALMKHCGAVDEVYICGGGAHNQLLMKMLQALLQSHHSGNIILVTTDAFNVGVDWVEAIAFAWLAQQCINKKTASLPDVTGAIGPRILGAIYQN